MRGMAQVVKHLSSKHEDLSSNPSKVKKLKKKREAVLKEICPEDFSYSQILQLIINPNTD
jgi:hypothetical protein